VKKFQWVSYEDLDDLVVDSGLRSVIETPAFLQLFREIKERLKLQDQWDGSGFTKQTLKVFCNSLIELILGQNPKHWAEA
jgi:hypothetical protein